MDKLITKLRTLKVDISLVEGKLKVSAPEGVLNKELLSELKDNKDRLVEYLKSTLSKDEYSSIKKAPGRQFHKLSSAQRRLFFLYEFNKSSIAYNMPQLMKLKGNVNVARLEETFRELIHRHQSLRTCFEIRDSEPVQKVLETVDFKIEIFKSDEFFDIINKFVRPFNLSKGPMIRVGLIEATGEEQILMIDTHHIITDGTSQFILNKEFMALYNREALSPLSLQYVDFVEWQHQDVSLTEKKNQKQFWLKEFAEELSPFQLPQDFPRPIVKSDRGDAVEFSVDEEQTRKLKAIAEKEETTLFMVLLAAYNILLAKLSNQEDIVVGTPVAGRQHADLENIIGLFVNMLALRNYPKGEITFREFLSDLKTRTLACLDHQDYQFEELVDDLKVQRDTSRNPLFDVMFAYENFQKYKFEIPGLSVETYRGEHTVAKFDLSLTAFEPEGKTAFLLEYCKDLFTKGTIHKFIAYFKNIVASITRNENVKLSDINILSDEERDLVTNVFNDTSSLYQKDKTIDALFKEVVGKKGSAPAVVFENQILSYDELNKRSNQLARVILEAGVQKEGIVGIMLGRSSHIFISILATLKAGCAYVPIDPDYPAERVKYITQNCHAALMLVEPATKQLYEDIGVSILSIDVTSPSILREDDSNFEVPHEATNLAYMIYTSGSTGNPKGVMIEHHNVVNMVKGMTERIDLSKVKSSLYLSTISFDMSILETFLPFLCGYRIVLANLNEKKDPSALAKLIAEHEVDMIQMTPSHLKLLVANKNSQSAMQQIKVILYGGEPSSLELIHELRDTYKGKFYNMYGPTETCVWSTGQDMTDKASINIGKPIVNTTIRILDRHVKIQPIGVPGELCIGGEGVARGYWNNSQLTSEKFIKDPLSNGIIYRTGDLAKWLPDGNLEFVGRVDNQVKIRGFRIELGEIESQIKSYENVDEAAVILKQNGNNKTLVAYYVSPSSIDTTSLKGYLLKKLPEYMVPTFYIHLDKLPLSPNGKLDKRALPDPEIKSTQEYVRPSNQLQKEIAEVWAEVLGLDVSKIGVNMNFFDIGGDSLKLAIMTNKVNQRLNTEIPVATMFKLPAVSLIADHLSKTDEESLQLMESVMEEDVKQMSSAVDLVQQLNG